MLVRRTGGERASSESLDCCLAQNIVFTFLLPRSHSANKSAFKTLIRTLVWYGLGSPVDCSADDVRSIWLAIKYPNSVISMLTKVKLRVDDHEDMNTSRAAG
jgi:hypothetical protein